MPFYELPSDEGRTIRRVDEFLIDLIRKDSTRLHLDLEFTPEGAVGVPTVTEIIKFFSEIRLQDGSDEQKARRIFEFDGEHYELIQLMLAAINQYGKYDKWGTANTPLESETLNVLEVPLTDEQGEQYFTLAMQLALSQMRDPKLYFRTRDPQSYFAYTGQGAEQPDDVEVYVDRAVSSGKVESMQGINKQITNVRVEHDLEMPKDMTVQAIGIQFSSGYQGNVLEIDVFDGVDQPVRIRNTGLYKFAEQQTIGRVTQLDSERYLISDILVDSRDGSPGKLHIKMDAEDDPVIYYAGIKAFVVPKPGSTTGQQQKGQGSGGMISATDVKVTETTPGA